MKDPDVQVLELALKHAYYLLNAVAEERGQVHPQLLNEIRKVLPPRYPMSFSHKEQA